jgi:hypothetical protein
MSIKRFLVTAPLVSIPQGAILALNDQQAHARAYALQPAKDGCYLTISPVEFKRGERIGFDDLPKELLSRVSVIDEETAAPAIDESVASEIRRQSSSSEGSRKRRGPKD